MKPLAKPLSPLLVDPLAPDLRELLGGLHVRRHLLQLLLPLLGSHTLLCLVRRGHAIHELACCVTGTDPQ